MSLTTNTRRIGDVIVLYCAGRITLGEESTSLRIQVKDLLTKSRQIVLDLGDANYIDSGGLGILVGLYTSARNADGNIKLANLHGHVTELLQVTKLLTVFEVYDTAEAAAASFQKAAGAA